MLAAERRQFIIDRVRQDDFVSSEDIAHRLQISLETVRRDLSVLEEQGYLMRVRGGASVAGRSGEEPPYAERSDLELAAKRAMALTAVSRMVPGMTIMIDIGTTCLEVARAVPADFRGRFVTPSLLVAAELAGRRDCEVLIAGGRVRSGDLSVSNASTVEYFRQIHPDLAFLGSGGIDAVAGLTDYHVDELAVRQIVIAQSAVSLVLADHAKHGTVASFHVADFAQIDGIICDELTDPALAQALRQAGTEVYTEPLGD